MKQYYEISGRREDSRTIRFLYYYVLSTDPVFHSTAEDGQRIFVHALNARCLVKEYGGLEHGPPTITAKIVELESVFMTEVSQIICWFALFLTDQDFYEVSHACCKGLNLTALLSLI